MKKWWWSPFEWSMLLFLMRAYCIVLTKMKRWKQWVSASPIFLKGCCQCNFPQIFKRRQIINKPCRNSRYPIRCLLWWHKTLPGAISKKTDKCKMCEKNFRHRCIKYKVNLHDIRFETFHVYELMFNCAM